VEDVVVTSTPSDSRLDPALRRLTWILVLGGIAPLLDSTIVNVALATLGRDLHASVAITQWTMTGYLLAMAIAMPVTGWATQRLGAKRLWILSLVLFVVGSALSGVAWSMTSLIVFRVVQGAAAGIMMPLLVTILVQAAGPGRLGRMMAIASLPAVVVPALGPVVGGLIVTNLSWRWIFYVNVPICLAAIVLAWRAMPTIVPTGERHRFDIVGLLTVSPGLALVFYGLAQVSGPTGFANAAVVVPIALGAVFLAAFGVHAARRHEGPLVNIRVLRIPSFAAAAGVFLLAGLSLYGPLLLLGLYYQDVQGKSALITGLLLAPQGVGSLIPRTVAGRLTDRVGPRLVVVTGLVLTVAGTLAFALAGSAPSDWLLSASLIVRGAGLAAVVIAVMAGAFQGVPHQEVPDASTMMRIVQQVGGSFGAAVLAVILASQLASHSILTATFRVAAFDTSFWWAIGFTVLALAPAALLPTRLHRHRAGLAPVSVEAISSGSDAVGSATSDQPADGSEARIRRAGARPDDAGGRRLSGLRWRPASRRRSAMRAGSWR
jgi:EmrB/QacA subfamily drug resistance transporter